MNILELNEALRQCVAEGLPLDTEIILGNAGGQKIAFVGRAHRPFEPDCFLVQLTLPGVLE